MSLFEDVYSMEGYGQGGEDEFGAPTAGIETDTATSMRAAFSMGENLTTAANWMFVRGGLGAIGQLQGDLVTPEEAQERYNVTITSDTSRPAIEWMSQEKSKRELRQFYMAQADKSATGSSFLPFVSGLAKGFLDPLGMAVGYGAAMAVNKAAIGVGFKSIHEVSAYQKAFRYALGGMGEGLVQEAPVAAKFHSLDQEYSAFDFTVGMLGATLGNTLFGTLGDFARFIPERVKDIESENAITGNGTHSGINNWLRSVDMDRANPAYPRLGQTSIQLTPHHTYYTVQKPGTIDIHAPEGRLFVGYDYAGTGVITTVEPGVALNSARNPFNNGNEGVPIAITLKENTNIFHLEAPLDKVQMKSVNDWLNKQTFHADAVSMVKGYLTTDGANARGMLDLIKRLDRRNKWGLLASFAEHNKKRGYDAYAFEGGRPWDDGAPGAATPETLHANLQVINPDAVRTAAPDHNMMEGHPDIPAKVSDLVQMNSYKGALDTKRPETQLTEESINNIKERDAKPDTGKDIYETLESMEDLTQFPAAQVRQWVEDAGMADNKVMKAVLDEIDEIDGRLSVDDTKAKIKEYIDCLRSPV